jgi:subtilisin family serine protease
MKKFLLEKIPIRNYSIFLLCFLTLGIFHLGYSQKAHQDGKIRIKFELDQTANLDGMTIQRSADGIVQTGIAELDQLNQQFQATSMKRVFRDGGKFEARHRKHGLHLWYELTVDADQNMRSMVRSYNSLTSVKMSEPILKKTRGYDEDPLSGPPNDLRYADQWHYNNTNSNAGTPNPASDINLEAAWSVETGSPEIVVAVIDGGIDVDHEDLASNMWVNEGEIPNNGIDDDNNGFVDDVFGYGFGDDTGTIPADIHGSHVGGTVAATSNNGIGVSGVAGGSGNGDGARLMSLASFGATNVGNFAEAFIYAADNGAVISQNSWGYSAEGAFEQAVLDAIDYFIVEAGFDANGNPVGPMQGGVVIFAAGNDDDDGEWYPGFYEPVVAVGGTGESGLKYSGSNFGPWVDITAPAGDFNPGVISTTPNNNYQGLTGTSMACPHVSGVAALILSKEIGNTITPQQLIDRLYASANPALYDNNPNFVGLLGAGMLDAGAALQEDEGIAPDAVSDLSVVNTDQTFAELSWTAPADTDNQNASVYEVRYSTDPITELNFVDAELGGRPSASDAGTIENFTVEGLVPETSYFFAVVSEDLFGNTSVISNVAEGTTTAAPVIGVGPANLTSSIDVQIDPIDNQTITIDNSGEGNLDYDLLVSFVTQQGNSINQLKGVQPLYDAEPRVTSPSRAGISNISQITKPGQFNSDYTDSLFYDSGDLAADDFLGLQGTAFSAATKFTPESSFTLSAINTIIRSETATVNIGVEIYRGGNTPSDGDLLLAQEVVDFNSAEGELVNIPLSESFTFAAGETFWIVLSFPGTIDFPLGFDELDDVPSTFYYSTNGTAWNDVVNDIPGAVYIVRALAGSGGAGWLSLNPSSGSLAQGETQDIDIEIDATNQPNGVYDFEVIVSSNDPVNPESVVPLEVTVAGQQPSIVLNAQILDFDNVFINGERNRSLTIENVGLGVLSVSDITSTDAVFSASQTTLEIDPGSSETIMITFAPIATGTQNSTLTIVGNNAEGNISIPLVGTGSEAPELDLNPVAVTVDLNAGETTQETVTISNTGLYPLQYSFPDFAEQSNTTQNGSGEDLEFGYSWIDSNEADGPVYSWTDISTTGDVVDVAGDGNTEIALPFNFRFYGETYDFVNVSANGFLTFGNEYGSFGGFSNQPIPTPSSPNAVIAPFWDDLEPSLGQVTMTSNPEKVVIQYTNTTAFFAFTTVTFQVHLYSNGVIEYYYEDVENASFLESATVGIENQDGTDGLQAVFNDEYLENGLVVRISNETSFITGVAPVSGFISPGESVDITASVSAEGLFDGTYLESLLISSNDPLAEQSEVVFTLNVTGTPDFELITSELSFDPLFIGLEETQEIEISNNGTKSFVVNTITADDGQLEIEFTDDTEIGPESTLAVPVTFVPATVGPLTAEITIVTEEGTEVITVTAEAVDPPVVSVSPNSIAETVDAGATVESSLSVSNQGVADLTYRVATAYYIGVETPEVNQSATVEAPVEKSDADNRVGAPVQYGAGNDDFGYTWYDNNTETDEVYEFEDISESGEIVDVAFDSQTEIVLPFAFRFYGQEFTTVNVSANGFLSFLDFTGLQFSNQEIPSSNLPNGIIAPFWDDLEPASGQVRMDGTAERLIIQYTDVEAFFREGTMTFQLVLYPDGKIEYLYEDVEENDFNASGTVGIESLSGMDGVEIAFNADYVENGLKVVIEPPFEGVLASGETASFPITLDATFLLDGVYEDDITVSSNDPLTPESVVDVTLTVNGTAVIEVADSLIFDDTFFNAETSFATSKNLVIRNTGTAAFEVDNVISAEAPFSIDDEDLLDGFVVEPLDSIEISFTFAPESVAEFSEAFVFGNSTSDESYSVAFVGNGLEASALALDLPADTLRFDLAQSEVGTATFSVLNTGGSPLNFSVSASAALRAQRVEPVEKQNFTGKMSDIRATGLNYEGFSGKSLYNDDVFTFTDSIFYDPEGVDDFVGLNDVNAPVYAATKFVPTSDFDLTHVKVFYRTEGSSNPATVEIYRGEETPDAAELVATYEYNGGAADGAYELINLGETLSFAEGETFWVVFAYTGATFPLGFNTDVSGVDGLYYLSVNEGAEWLAVENIDGFANTALKIRALSGSVLDLFVLTPESGEVAADGSQEVSLDVAAQLFPVTGQLFGSLNVNTDAPIDASAQVPLDIYINQSPQQIFGPLDTLRFQERDTIMLSAKAIDPDGTVESYEMVSGIENMTVTMQGDTAMMMFVPGYDQAGSYEAIMRATDNRGDFVDMSLFMEIEDLNRMPFLDSSIREVELLVDGETQTVDLSTVFGDLDGDSITVTVTIPDNELFTFERDGAILSFTPLSVEGDADISLLAQDGKGGVAGSSFVVSVMEEEEEVLSNSDELKSEIGLVNYPNPFTSSTTVVYNLPRSTKVSLIVLDQQGRIVKEVLHEVEQSAGENSIELKRTNLDAGVYYYQLSTSEFVLTEKLMIE